MNEMGSDAALAPHRLEPRVESYLQEVIRTSGGESGPLVSLVLFGSAVTGGYTAGLSDVDLLLVLRDGTSAEERLRLRQAVEAIEARHGLSKPHSARQTLLEGFAERITANVRAFFICTRSDLLSGNPGKILDLSPAQAQFVDRGAIPSIVGSAVVVWGEELLGVVPLPPIRRLDIAKAFFGLFNQVLFSAAVYPLLPAATRYAMDALKRSVHNCYFSHHGRPAPLAAEISYFEHRYGASRTLKRLLELRRDYRPSFSFVLAALPSIAWLHLRTALGLRFPREVPPRSGK
jgi:predicted nucleotidyltransferase